MKALGSKLVAQALSEQGVELVFGIPGTHNIELYDAMLDEPSIKAVLVTDEQSTGFMADGVWRASGKLAAINLVPGAGLTHAMSGIAECFLDQIPLLVLLSGIREDTGHAFQLHAVKQAQMVAPVAKKVFHAGNHAELYRYIHEAARLARTPPYGPAVVEIPVNLFLFEGEAFEVAPNTHPERNQKRPAYSSLSTAVQLLNTCDRIGLYLGLGAQDAGSDLMALAEKLAAPVFTSISGKGVFPENHALWAWNTMGPAAPVAVRKLGEELDCVLAIGCRFGEVATASYGFKLPQNLIHVDVDPSVFNRNYRTSLAIQSDSGHFVKEMLGLSSLRERDIAEISSQLRKIHNGIRSEQHKKGKSKDLVSPPVLFNSLQEVFGANAIFCTDSGNGTFLAMENLVLPHARKFLAPVDYSCMGYCVPAAIGAKLSNPAQPVVALAGDGAFLMTGLELITAKVYGAGVVTLLLRDQELSQIAQFQRASLVRETCTQLHDFDTAALAQALGIPHFIISRDDQITAILKEAQALSTSGQPVIVDVAIDYSEPTYFSKGVVRTNFLRFPFRDRLRLASRFLGRKLLGTRPAPST